MAAGGGMTFSDGWLWAPGYPTLLAIHESLSGVAQDVRGTQIVVAFATTWLVYWLTWQIGQGVAGRSEAASRRGAAIASWLFACNPSGIFFAVSLWSELIYGSVLLTALAGFERCSRGDSERPQRAALFTGVALGVCVLFRGVATYMLPLFAGVLLFTRRGRPGAALCAGLLVAATIATVAPYSAYISTKFGAFTISDRTLGRMMYLGNNDFSPVDFDYGSGVLGNRRLKAHTATGRPHCAPPNEGIRLSRCSLSEGFEWILEHPGTFLARIPERIAQLVNPHSFLTRHLRLGRSRAIPPPAREGLVLADALLSITLMLGGVLGLAAFGRGPMGLLVSGVLLYHLAVIAALAGMTRYRVPLEPLLMIYTALALADRRALTTALRREPWRAAVAAAALLVLLPLILWHLPSGWPAWKSW